MKYYQDKASAPNEIKQSTQSKFTYQPLGDPPKISLISENSIHNEKFSVHFKQFEKLCDCNHFVHDLEDDFRYIGRVQKGKQLGRQWGIPTANIDAEHMYPCLSGIFYVKIRRKNGQSYQGVASVGKRPTVRGSTQVLEVFIFNFSGDLYGEVLEILFVHKLRDEIKFSSIDALIGQIYDDIHKAQILFPD
ncbi:riboflavin biosynthesis protein RibF (riboflavin kinase/FMN adenylyltransferase) [Legionella quinlivanii]|uniref:riboflavin kinase n=1 Tax=Legionella quinlivanii TaxID=45073 RepID=A0A0W0XU82_9GAMM|nr:riboflavin kinase [Legionella quinlivanii]KTD47970.1 riboflavin biosynthesis protein RibF (riboflavin kinase/FMN adenylyltransferase) [Legionella quinlivanii]MCW8450750.1 riboflavin kinase [Legionella quinlivanii]SEG20305.1 riboflavin kinase/FMN adenylyltransferase [Legionella quinlivanii DSM 21216]STY11081.1 riboflavin kinase [Legionella quinlivanii]